MLLSSPREVAADYGERGFYEEEVGSFELEKEGTFAKEDGAFGEESTAVIFKDVKIVHRKIGESIW